MYYTYSVWQWLLVFFIYCFLGWCFESTVVSLQQKRFVNRGFLRGPALPVYGFGAILLLHIALPLYNRPVLLFFSSMAAATAFEYIVGVTMEKLFRVKYWDYSGHRFQYGGYICLQSSVCWGVMGLLLSGLIQPPIERLVFEAPSSVTVFADSFLFAGFMSDVIVSVQAALGIARMLEELDKLREEGAALKAKIEENALVQLTNLSYKADEMRSELEAKAARKKDELQDKAENAKAKASERLEELERRFDKKASKLGKACRSLIMGNPSASSKRYDEVFQKLKLKASIKK